MIDMATATGTVTQRLPVLSWGMRADDTPNSLMIRRVRLVAAVVSILIGLYLAVTNREYVLPTLFFLWLAFTFIIPVHGFLIGYSLLTIYPVSRALTVALRPTGTLLSTSLAVIPPDATLDNFKKLFEQTRFVLWLWNTLTISLAVSVIGVAVSATSAYAFSRFRFPGRSPGLLLLLTTQMLPAGMMLIPLFIIVSNLQL